METAKYIGVGRLCKRHHVRTYGQQTTAISCCKTLHGFACLLRSLCADAGSRDVSRSPSDRAVYLRAFRCACALSLLRIVIARLLWASLEAACRGSRGCARRTLSSTANRNSLWTTLASAPRYAIACAFAALLVRNSAHEGTATVQGCSKPGARITPSFHHYIVSYTPVSIGRYVDLHALIAHQRQQSFQRHLQRLIRDRQC